MAPVDLCAEFNLFPDETNMPQNFVLSGFNFQKVVPGDRLFVNFTGDRKALQFSPSGVEARLPIPLAEVVVQVGTFDRPPVTVDAIDSAGTVVAQQSFPRSNRFDEVTMSAREINSLRFHGGGGEAAIGRICVKL
jgi:hypothetical protein